MVGRKTPSCTSPPPEPVSKLSTSLLAFAAVTAALWFRPATAQPNTLSIPSDYAHDPTSYVDPSVVSASDALELIQRREFGVYAYSDLLDRVAASANAAFIGDLLDVADAYAAEDRERRAYAALSVARRLGASPATFTERAMASDHGALAAAAILVLAQDPTLREFERLRTRHPDLSPAAEALGSYRSVLVLQEEWARLDDTRARVRLVLPHVLDGLSVWGFGADDLPGSVWARARLRMIAEDESGVVDSEVEASLRESGIPDDLRARAVILVGTVASAPPFLIPVPRPTDPFSNLSGAVVAAGSVSPSFNGTAFSISGTAVDLSGVPDAAYDPVRGIATLDDASATAVLGALSSRQASNVTGLGPAPDIAAADLPFDAAAFADDLAALATVTLDARPSGPVGTETAPVVAYAPSGARLSGGFRGAGVLVVDGDFEMLGNAEWLGLVVVRGSSNQQADPALSGNPRILGALLVLPGEGGGAAALRLSGQVSVLYSPEALALAAAAAAQ